MKKRWISLLLAAAMVLIPLTGCGGEDMPELSLESVTAPVPATSSEAVLTALAEYSGVTEAAPEQTDSLATVQFAGESNSASLLHDGYLYVLSNTELRVLSAAGADTALLQKLSIASGAADTEDSYEYANAVLADGSRLAVITSSSTIAATETGYGSKELCHIQIYDISRPESPSRIAALTQDGLYQAAGIVEGQLYVLSANSIDTAAEALSEDDLPKTGVDGTETVIPAAQIYLSSALDTPAYSIITAISMEQGVQTGVRAFTGAIGQGLFTTDGLYLARDIRMEAHGEAYRKDHYSVTNHSVYAVTELLRLSCDSTLTLQASVALEGSLAESRYDAASGTVQLVSARESSQYQLFTDEDYGWTNRLDLEQTSGAVLKVLSKELQPVSETQLSGERLSDAVFSGNRCLSAICSSETPLAVWDLSDPANPAAVEVSGLSDLFNVLLPSGDTLVDLTGAAQDDGMQLLLSVITAQGNQFTPAALPLELGVYQGGSVSAALSPDGTTALVSFDGVSRLIHLGTEPQEIAQPAINAHSGVNFLFSGEILYTCAPDEVNAINCATGEVTAQLSFAVG